MEKFKVRYYDGNDRINEKEIEAVRFDTGENTNGMSVVFYEGANFKIFAFSNFISIEKVD